MRRNLIGSAIVLAFFCFTAFVGWMAFLSGYNRGVDEGKQAEFYFEGDKEVTRVYYEGFITIKVNEETLEIILEDWEVLRWEKELDVDRK